MIKFGTGGWRAVIGDEFIKSNIQLLAKAMCNKMKAENKTDKGIIIGYDKRFLSKEAMQWMGQVFAAEGIETLLVNKSAPTPLLMFYVEKHELPYGMMVTASHNPAIYNGVKVFTYGGRDADEYQTKEIEDYASKINPDDIKEMDYEEAKKEGLIKEVYPLNEYLDNIIAAVDMKKIKEAGLRVALDPMYGVSEIPLKTLLLTARCDVETIHDRHDTLFGGKLPSPTASTLRGLITRVMDDTGRFLHPNDILVLLYYYLVKYKGWHGAVVRNVATTHMLDKVAKKFGEECYEVPVGFKYISAKMTEVNAVIGGESSGGLTVRGHINGKDGIYAAMLLIEMIAVTGRKISEIYKDIEAECGSIYMEERDYKFSPQKKEEIHELLMIEKKLPELPYEIDHVSYMDGCKVYFKNGGWVIGRFSGTEPLIRIFCEMPEKDDAIKVCEIFEKFLGLK